MKFIGMLILCAVLGVVTMMGNAAFDKKIEEEKAFTYRMCDARWATKEACEVFKEDERARIKNGSMIFYGPLVLLIIAVIATAAVGIQALNKPDPELKSE
jgi:predicted nucleic acid-binding Zn ribbon protein